MVCEAADQARGCLLCVGQGGVGAGRLTDSAWELYRATGLAVCGPGVSTGLWALCACSLTAATQGDHDR